MKISIIPVDDRTLQALIDRFHARADAYGIKRDEAMREAMRKWLERTDGVESEETRVLEATETELVALKAVLAAMRCYGPLEQG